MRKKVHITDIAGNLLYTRLWDDGSSVLAFDSGFGFIDRLDVGRFQWKVKAGWKSTGVNCQGKNVHIRKMDSETDEVRITRRERIRCYQIAHKYKTRNEVSHSINRCASAAIAEAIMDEILAGKHADDEFSDVNHNIES